MQKKIIALIFMTALLMGCDDLDSIETPRKSIKKDGNVVLVEGRWKATPGTKPGIISKTNFTSIACDRSNMTCKEIESLVFTPKEQPILKNNLLYNQEFTYQVIHWSDDTIKAKREPLVADVEITIS